MTAAAEISVDPKRARILEAAAGVFIAYGFQRTTMDDIARAAEMSRPAVYLQFRNKTEIFRELAAVYVARSAVAARQALVGDGPLAPRVVAMFEAGFIAMHEEFSASPHGEEIVDLKGEIAGEVIEGWRRSMSEALAEAIAIARRGRSDEHRTSLPAGPLADMLIDSFEGAKMRGATAADLRVTAKQLGILAERAI